LKPLFIWAGGKSRLLKHYAPYWPKDIKTYSEPFFGGGAVFIYMVQNYDLQEVWINDINKDLINIYQTVKSDVGSFIKLMDNYSKRYLPLIKEDRKKYYFDLRHENAFCFDKWNTTEQATALYFLMKTGFNGIWQINKNTNERFGTPSGLLNQKNKVYDKDNVLEWNEILNTRQVNIHSLDWAEIPLGDFTFYDPPYRGSFTSYGTSFPDSETEKLIKVVENNSNVWLTNRDIGDGFFDNRKCHRFSFDVTYTAGRRKKLADGTFVAKPAREVLLIHALNNE
jgi:DNA adenine methylase|tara:strand:+ start:630 stop:1475 length:846 start_codon:yes stop_codon:yes gene_type:complete